MGESSRHKLTAVAAVMVGHAFVTMPILAFIAAVGGTAWSGLGWGPRPTLIAIIVAAGTAWLWWSFAIPRWRRWALRRGVDRDALQRVGVATGLVWPRGWIFEKTEFRRKDEWD